MLGILCLKLSYKKPIVVIESGDHSTFYQGTQKDIELSENNIKNFVEKFIVLYSNWDDFKPEAVVKNMEPFLTEGLKEYLSSNLKNRKEKEFLGKKIQQNVSGISVQINKDSIVAIYDVVLRVDNIPLVVPTQLSLQIVKGTQTEWNPMGLYVNNITIHEGK